VDHFQSSILPQAEPREALPSPGVGLRHYAPRAELVLIKASLSELPHELTERARRHPSERIGLMLPDEIRAATIAASDLNVAIFPWGSWSNPEELARNLYAGLRALDAKNCTLILCPVPPGDGLGVAIRDRLLKAAH